MRAWGVAVVLAGELIGIGWSGRAWRSERVFWQRAVQDAPTAVAPRINLAVSLGVAGQIADARLARDAAWARLSDDPSPLIQRANMAWNLTNLDRALSAPPAVPEPVSSFIDEDRLWLASARMSLWGRRPLTRLSLRWNAGATVWSYRLTNLALHIGAALLLWALVGSWPAAAIWFLLPWHAETVMTLAGRGELLAGIGLLGACLAAQSSRWGWGLLSIAVAFASKESAIVILALLPLWLTRRRLGPAWVSIGTILLIEVCLWQRLAGRVPYVQPSPWRWATDQAVAFWTLVSHLYHPPVYLDPRAWPLVAQGLAVVGMVGLAVHAAVSRRPALVFGLTWALLALLPRFIVTTPGAYLHSRHLYVASMGLAWASART